MSKYYVKKDWHESVDRKHRLAIYGEDMTAKYMQESLHMTVIERNVRFRFGEIDIVARDGRTICFTEVKTRTGLKYGRPSEALTCQKQQRLKKLAQLYLCLHRQYSQLGSRLDVSEILISDGKTYINYIKNAF